MFIDDYEMEKISHLQMFSKFAGQGLISIYIDQSKYQLLSESSIFVCDRLVTFK